MLPLVQPYFDSKTVATIVSAAAIFFVALIVASYITMKISDFVIDSRVGAVDRALGFVFGAVRGLLLMIVALWFFNFLVKPPPAWIANAQTPTRCSSSGGDQLIALLPRISRRGSRRRSAAHRGVEPAAARPRQPSASPTTKARRRRRTMRLLRASRLPTSRSGN